VLQIYHFDGFFLKCNYKILVNCVVLLNAVFVMEVPEINVLLLIGDCKTEKYEL
jgi:hypothetical protein